MSVTTLHPDYIRRAGQWQVIRDCVEGEDAIKGRGEFYLPRMGGATDCQYEAYKKRARWNNYTARNLQGLHGLIFRRSPVTNCSEEFKNTKILDNIDRKGTNLNQFLSDTVYDLMQTSFGGYLIDLPSAEGVTTVSEAEAAGVRPYLRYYPAESIINWGYTVINGVEQLAFVVLKEMVEDYSDDEFERKLIEQYRVLDARSGTYVQRIFRKTIIKDPKKRTQEEAFAEVTTIPVIVNGNSLSEIPFVLIPSDHPEKPMFYDLAMCNIGHYQKTADYENGVHLTTIPTLWVTGHEDRNNDGDKEVIHLGWDAALIFPEAEAKVGNLSFSGVGLVHSETAITQSLADMAILGSRLLASEKGVSESSDSARIHRAGENATLATFAKNISERVTKVLNIMAKWLDIEGTVTVELCTDYDTLAFDPNALNAIANLAEAGKLPLPYVFDILLNGEYTPTGATFEEYAVLLEMERQGATPTEIIEQYRAIQQGKKVVMPKPRHDVPVEEEEKVEEEIEA